jgi:GTPase SAR1 family protein
MTFEGAKTCVSLEEFKQKQKQVEACLADIRQAAHDLGAPEVTTVIDAALGSMQEEKFRLVVVGEFSHGKSTLINALLGDRVLPSSVQPTTAILSVISGNDVPKFKLLYRDNRKPSEISQEEFIALVAPPDPDRNSLEQVTEYESQVAELKKIAQADIGFPSPLLISGVELVDTPGTNDLDPVREQITYEFIPQADAVVIVLSAKRILAQSEVDFIRDRILKADIQRLFFAINFADFLKTDVDRSKVVEYARSQLRPIVGEPRLFLVCAKDALHHRRGIQTSSLRKPLPFTETGFRELEEALSNFLNGDRGAVKLGKPIAIGVRLTKELSSGPLAVRKAGVGLSAEALQQKIHSLKPHIVTAQLQKNEVLDGLKSRFANEGSAIAFELRKGLENIALAGVAAVDTHQGELTGEAILQSVERAVAPLQTRLVEHIKSRQESTLSDEYARARRRIEAAWGDLQTTVDQTFSISQDLSLTIDNSKAPSKDEDNVVFGGGIFAGLLMAAMHVAFPIAIVVGLLTTIGLGAGIEQRRREAILGKARFQIDNRLRDGIPQAITKFELDWKRLSDNIISSVDSAFSVRLNSLQSQLNQLENQKQSELENARLQAEWCETMNLSLQRATRVLEAMR